MKVDKKLVDKVARLAKLEFDKDAKEKMVSDMNVMISFIDKLEEIDTESTEPLVYVIEETNVLRADETGLLSTKEDALKNAPHKDSDYFKVPKVLDK
mgnify:CR=1 FL=1